MTAYTGIAEIDALFAAADETTNPQGNRVRQIFRPAERYLFDFNIDSGKWAQFDTESDAWYFGIWIHKRERKILSYIEGDIYMTECDDDESYDREIAVLCDFHAPAPAFVVLNEKGRTEHYMDRAELFIDATRFTGRNWPDREDTP